MIMDNENDNASAKRETVLRLLYSSLVGPTTYRSLIPLAQNKRIITGLTAILFDQESSSDANRPTGSIPTINPDPWSCLIAPPLSLLSLSGQSGARMVASLIEHMLLIDYGLGEHPLRPLGPEPRWMTNHMTRVVCHECCKSLTKMVDDCRSGKEIFYRRLAWMDEFIHSYEDRSGAHDDFSDVSLMFYFFWTRRRNISKDEYNRGMTGYKGVLFEMMSEVAVMGTDRLTRKLSVDLCNLIPRYIKDMETRAEVVAVAKRTAVEYGVVLRAPRFAFENLRRPSDYNRESPPREEVPSEEVITEEVITEQDSERSYDTPSWEREVSPPPSYAEAVGQPLPER